MENIDEQQQKLIFDNMGIFQLRTYARYIGVRSSTTKNREELIDNILPFKMER